MPSFHVENSVAFVTGTNKPNGIGRAVVEALLSQGAQKVYATARDASQLDDLVEKHNGKVVAVSLDVTDYKAVASLADKYPDVNLLVNNAGYLSGKASSLDDIEAARKEIEINYVAPMALVKTFSTNFQKLEVDASSNNSSSDFKPSAVVNIASIASLVNFPIAGTYSASKAAAHSLTQAQRRDLSQTTLVVGVYPGPIDTDMADGLPFDKTPPSSVANSIVEALGNGNEDVFPDPMVVQLYDGWKADAKAVEQQMAQSVSA